MFCPNRHMFVQIKHRTAARRSLCNLWLKLVALYACCATCHTLPLQMPSEPGLITDDPSRISGTLLGSTSAAAILISSSRMCYTARIALQWASCQQLDCASFAQFFLQHFQATVQSVFRHCVAKNSGRFLFQSTEAPPQCCCFASSSRCCKLLMPRSV